MAAAQDCQRPQRLHGSTVCLPAIRLIHVWRFQCPGEVLIAMAIVTPPFAPRQGPMAGISWAPMTELKCAFRRERPAPPRGPLPVCHTPDREIITYKQQLTCRDKTLCDLTHIWRESFVKPSSSPVNAPGGT